MIRRIAHLWALLAILFAAMPALAVGYWNVPGNVAQCWGYGWGAGHHACLVLGPISPKGAFAHNHKRLPYAPQPDYGCYEGCTFNYDFRHSPPSVPVEYQPSPSPPTLTPDALPMPEATPAPGAILPAPVE
jgi:hypothetical protein